jgi:hypothetical protein
MIELRESTAHGGPARGLERVFAFSGALRLRLVRDILKGSSQSGPCDSGGPLFFSVAFAAGVPV